MAKKKVVADILFKIGKIHFKEITIELIEIWVEVLEEKADSWVLEGFKRYSKDPKNKRFPVPAEFLDYCFEPESERNKRLEAEYQAKVKIDEERKKHREENKEEIEKARKEFFDRLRHKRQG